MNKGKLVVFGSGGLSKSFVFFIIFLLAFSAVAQKKSKTEQSKDKPVMWERVNIRQRNLFLGPGGREMRPDLSRITLIKKEKGGTSLKYRVKDGSDRVWVAKIDKESQPETASVRLLWALGYKNEINYLVPNLTIPGKGTFKDVRLEARPENVKRKGRWKWSDNPFNGTNELQGLKIMMALLNNWDLKNGNTIILQKGNERQYVISDLGATFGKYGSNNLPIFWRIGRSINKPKAYSESKFIKGTEDGRIKFAFKGKDRWMFKDITIEQGRWLTNLLSQLSEKQIEDAFRAANYSSDEVKMLTQAVKNRIADLNAATRGENLAEHNRKKFR